MHIFVTLDRHYLLPLRIMLTSLFLNNPGERFDVYLAGDGMTGEDLASLQALCHRAGGELHPVAVPADAFAGAPVIRYYSRAMYYRLLAAQLLPDTLDKALYLDPDVLIINRVRPLYETDLGPMLCAAATHEGLTGMSSQIARIRLSTPEARAYFNSGVLMMNLSQMRRDVHPQQVFDYADRNRAALILPDQDILNGLLGDRILPIDESVWNYDARKYQSYLLASQNEKDLDWVMRHTAILHFCGKAKPWKPSYHGKFAALYKHYAALTERGGDIFSRHIDFASLMM